MNATVKFIIGLLITVAGIYWYVAEYLGFPAFQYFGAYSINALKTVFFGVFGLFLLLVGLLVMWIEYEDIKWSREEKKGK